MSQGSALTSKFAQKEPGEKICTGWWLTGDRISDIEHKIGSGLIEEVVRVAQGELELVDEIARSQA